MVYEFIFGLLMAIVGASQVFTATPWLNWPRSLIDKVCSKLDKKVGHALKVTFGWPMFLFGILVALPLSQRYDFYAALLLIAFFVIYKVTGQGSVMFIDNEAGNEAVKVADGTAEQQPVSPVATTNSVGKQHLAN